MELLPAPRFGNRLESLRLKRLLRKIASQNEKLDLRLNKIGAANTAALPFRKNGPAYYGDKTFEEVTGMNKEKWTDKSVTWGGLIKISSILTAISLIMSAVYYLILIEPSWWTGFRKTASKLFNGWIRRKARF